MNDHIELLKIKILVTLNAFNKLKITRNDRKIDDVNDVKLPVFKSKTLNAIDQIKQKKKRPDLDTTYEYMSKTEAANADKQFIETILGNFIETNITLNRKTPKGLVSFQRLKVVETPVLLLILILNKQALQVIQKLRQNFQRETGLL